MHVALPAGRRPLKGSRGGAGPITEIEAQLHLRCGLIVPKHTAVARLQGRKGDERRRGQEKRLNRCHFDWAERRSCPACASYVDAHDWPNVALGPGSWISGRRCGA